MNSTLFRNSIWFAVGIVIIFSGVGLFFYSLTNDRYHDTLEDAPYRKDIPFHPSEITIYQDKLKALNGSSYRFVRGPEYLALEKGLSFAYLGEHKNAIEAFSQVFRASTEKSVLVDTRYNLGRVHIDIAAKADSAEEQIDNLFFAKNHFEEALRLNPEDEDARFNLEKIYRLFDEMGIGIGSPGDDDGDGFNPGTDEKDF